MKVKTEAVLEAQKLSILIEPPPTSTGGKATHNVYRNQESRNPIKK